MSVYRHLTLAEREYIMVQRARGRMMRDDINQRQKAT